MAIELNEQTVETFENPEYQKAKKVTVKFNLETIKRLGKSFFRRRKRKKR